LFLGATEEEIALEVKQLELKKLSSESENPKEELKEQKETKIPVLPTKLFNQQSLITQMNTLLNPNYQAPLNPAPKKEVRVEELKPVELNIKIDEVLR